MIRLLTQKDIKQATEIVAMAYPGMNISQATQQAEFAERLTTEQVTDNDLRYYGFFDEENKLVGLYRLHDFLGNINGKMVRQFGIGMVAVHLFHKKERIAFHLLQHFHELAQNEQVSLVSLYPFNTGFYRKMGYGYGPTRYQYKLKPTSFPSGGDKHRVKLLSPAIEEEIVQLYNEYAATHHGMIKRTWNERNLIKKKASYYAGVYEEDKLVGAIAYILQPVKDSHFLHHELVVFEWFWIKPSAFLAISAWLNSQQDQVERVIIRTQDEAFMYQLEDPRNDSNRMIPSVYHEVAQVGTGLMYRLISVEEFVKQSNFSSNVRPDKFVSMSIFVEDSFSQEIQGGYKLTCKNNIWEVEPSVITQTLADLSISINDLSSWWMGCISLEQLIKYGKVELNDGSARDLDSWFKPNMKPICFTSF
ncbi:GNAT family N-acetyltransferase [Paenisporosarcina indica]|uniref:GNAT family N-acetyltransferase n=1 Tax=Paenisporosarcina indica TaxID=650093 RepID=UPI00094F90EC|nr:GNAT family N-acetyltransferase [Paenisporosarcina indica]